MRTALGLILVLLSALVEAQERPVYLDAAAPVEARVEDLLGRMTLAEKAGQMTQVNYQLVNPAGDFSSAAVELDEDRLRPLLQECAVGSFLNGSGVPAADYVRFITRLEEVNQEETRLGIPFLYGIDHVHGAQYLAGATIFPQPINLAATFDPRHAEAMAQATVQEAAALGHSWNFAPVLDLALDVRWPRLWETFGEDPLLTARLGAAYVEALQGEAVGPYRMAATAKHFVGYGDPRTGWDRTPGHVPDQQLWELHLPPFQAAIDAGLDAVMVNSGEVNGVPVHASRALLTDVLRGRMGFEGVVLTDWGDVQKLVDMHRVAGDAREAARLAVEAGVDMSMTAMTLDFCHDVVALAEAGALSEARIDESVRRILRLKFALGLFDRPPPTLDYADRIGSEAHRRAAREAAAASLVLLVNDTLVTERPALPLRKPARVVVAGPFAESRSALAGGWTYAWQGAEEGDIPADVPSVATALRGALPEAEVVLADSVLVPGDEAAFREQVGQSDAVVLVLGEAPYTEFIGNRIDLTLPDDQAGVVRAAAEAARAGVPVVIVYVGGRPLVLGDAARHADAIVWAGLPGFEGAEAIADLLVGRAAPSGRLPFSWPRGPSIHLPYHHKPSALFHFASSNDLSNDPDSRGDPRHPVLFPFGSGLGYQTVQTTGLALADTTIRPGETVRATVEVVNRSQETVEEVVLWTLTDEVASITRPVRSLEGFERVRLGPGERRTLPLPLGPSELGFPGADGRLVLESGRFTLHVGEESASFVLVE